MIQTTPLSPQASHLVDQLTLAHSLRNSGQFQQAAQRYLSILQAAPGHAETHHNLALCLLGLGQFSAAVQSARRALACSPNLTPARLILAKGLRLAEPESPEPEELLQSVATQDHPLAEHARLALAEFSLNYRCDAHLSAQWASQVKSDGPMAEQAGLASLSAGLYQRTQDDVTFSQSVRRYAQRFIDKHDPAETTAPRTVGQRSRGRRTRILVLSCALKSGPIYSMGYDSLLALADRADLIFFHRGQRTDDSTKAFKQMSTAWIDCWQWDWATLASALRDEQADVLLEMSGWMDPEGLKAVSTKPAGRQFKWIGGQSVSTGLDCFDGFIGDMSHMPPGVETLYTEPVIRLEPSYAGFRWPLNVNPVKSKQPRKTSWGIIGNPTKVSSDLRRSLTNLKATRNCPQELQFIDRRYQRKSVQERILALLDGTGFRPVFEVPIDQRDFYKSVQGLSAMIDTTRQG
jgi:protein O-GlcNAc transferase